MSKLFKNSKQIFALVMAFAILAVSLFTGIVVSAEDGTENVATALCGGSIVYWNGSTDSKLDDNGEKGTVDNPIIIDSAEELNYLANNATNTYKTSSFATKDKYYKMADGIGYMILQPEGKLDVERLLACENGAKVSEYFNEIGLDNLSNWSARDAETWFAGHFDGNGVIIAGMYAKSRSAGLFPTADATAVFENFAVVNSYIITSGGNCRTGAIVGGTCGPTYGVGVSGVVKFESIMVANNYIYAGRNQTAGAVIMGSDNADDTASINNAIVYGNETACSENTNPLYLTNGHTGGGDMNTVTNSVILGTTPYRSSFNKNSASEDCFENVITDANVEPWDDKADYADTDLKSVAGLSAYQIVKEYSNMFKLFHNDVTSVQTGKTHSLVCEKCNFVFYGGETAHNFNVSDVDSDGTDDYICSDCGYQCFHNIDYYIDEEFPGDCVTAAGIYYKCYDCGRETVENIVVGPLGHSLEWVEERPADCEHEGAVEGRLGYWHCTVCGSNFTGTKAEALNAAMDTSIADPENDERLRIPLVPHNATSRADGSIHVEVVGNDGHYWVCYTCEGKLLAVESKKVETTDKVKKHNYTNGVCVDCGWECPEHDYQPTGKILVAGSCTVDREDEVKCTNCGNKKSVATPAKHDIQKVAEVAATDKLEGTKAHYACKVCGEVYADAEGKTKVTTASLVIPKVLPAEYQNVVVGGDTSTKSPATSDSLVSVMAVAALAGVAFVIARKAKNA